MILDKRDFEWKVLRYLNARGEKRTYKFVDSIELIDDYYRVEVGYTDHFVSGDIDDTGIYFIDKAELD